mmetsp:Transcript_4983/g.11893  ORF Transcript_4983/g.11893 Transcript_4983/m.11893 type:complete len:358 (+) Transcript_4983:107-1180(+)
MALASLARQRRTTRHQSLLLVPLLVLAPPLVLRWDSVSAFSATTKASNPIPKPNNQGSTPFDTKSCSPPRFDVFAESLVGEWAIEGVTSGSSENNVGVAIVEEVMRSCGGAVQGIREPETGKEKQGGTDAHERSTYLNRANDGFVFFDDGSYTMGPLSIKTQQTDDFLSCLVVPEKDSEGRAQRLVLGFGPSEDSESLPHIATMRTKQRFGDETTAVSSGLAQSSHNDAIEIEEITHMLRCRMPAEGQPWMLQRAKWETLLPSNKDNDDLPPPSESEEDGVLEDQEQSLVCWVTSESAQGFSERLGITIAEEGIVVHSGVACPKTKTLRLLARQYQRSGEYLALCGIVRVEGSVRFR